MIICPYCGSPTTNSLKCDSCGKKIDQSDTSPSAFSKRQLKGSLVAPKKTSVPSSYHDTEQSSADNTSNGRLKGSLVGGKSSVSKRNVSFSFKRAPRLKDELPSETVDISAPPSAASKPEINWLSTLLPAGLSIALAVMLVVIMGNIMMMVYTLPMTLGGLVISIVNYHSQTKKYKENIKKREEKYAQHLDDSIARLRDLRDKQLAAMNHINPDIIECYNITKCHSPRLWERRAEDDDFLSCRIGNGIVSSSYTIHIPKYNITLEEDDLKNKPQGIYDRYHELSGAPIILNIPKEQVCGIVGKHNIAVTLLQNIIVQLTTLHFYRDLQIVLICDPLDLSSLGWVSDLPHATIETESGLHIAASKEDAASMFANCISLLKQRKELRDSDDSYGGSSMYLPYYLFIISQPAFLRKSDPINDYLFRLNDLGIGVIMTVDNISQLPKECNEIIQLESSNGGYCYHKDHASERIAFSIDINNGVSLSLFSEIMSQTTCEEESLKDSLPRQYSFFEMLGITDANQLNIMQRWKSSDINRSMAVPIGILEDGKFAYLDLHQNAHGPHGLVAGTTGYGKSELLLTYILSTAITFSPDEVCFVLIDFKGGQTASHLVGLPHLVGVITDIDGNGEKTVERSLLSINAEVNRRKEILRRYNDTHSDKIDDIYGYIKKYKMGEVKDPLPHLILVVDEFAELKQDYPDFIKELVSVSRIGRSVGVHLILATQKPSGSVSDEIAVNSRFRLCLKVSPSESKEVIKSPVAATILEKGRAYLRVGENEIFDLFQSAYSKAPVPTKDKESSQREEIIHKIIQECAENGIIKQSDIYLPPLVNTVLYPFSQEQKITDNFTEISVNVGIYDAPEQQYQGVLSYCVTGNNMLLVGSPQYGKTNLLQVIIRDLSSKYTPADVNLYVIDYASSFLLNYQGLPHIGGIVCPSDQERMNNLFKMLNAEIDERNRRFSALGVSSFKAYREAGHADLPQIILMVDNFTALKEDRLSDDDFLLPVLRKGVSVGISVIIANSQSNGLTGYNYSSTISNKLALYCNDDDEYSSLFEYTKKRIEKVPGRCMVQVNGNLTEAQCYLAFEGEKEIDRTQRIRTFIQTQKNKYPSLCAKPIPEVPATLHQSDLYNYPTPIDVASNIAVGVDYASINRVVMPFDSQFMLAFIGKDAKRKSQYLDSLLYDVRLNLPKRSTQLYFIDSVKKSYKRYADYPFVSKYTSHAEDITSILEDVTKQLQARYEDESLYTGDNSLDCPLIMLIINNSKALDFISNSKAHLKMFEDISKSYRECKVLFIISDIDNTTVTYSSAEIIKRIRDERKAIIFDPLKDVKLYDIRDIKKIAPLADPFDAFFLDGDTVLRIKLPDN